jgi:putative sterol carrier protein
MLAARINRRRDVEASTARDRIVGPIAPLDLRRMPGYERGSRGKEPAIDDSPVQQLTAEELAELVHVATDQQIEAGIRVVGTAEVLDRIFSEMAQRFLPDRAAGVTATAQWVVTDRRQEHPYRMSIAEGGCSVERGRADHPDTTLTLDIVSFAKLVTGKREGVQLFMLGTLRITGGLPLAVRLNGSFRKPQAGTPN